MGKRQLLPGPSRKCLRSQRPRPKLKDATLFCFYLSFPPPQVPKSLRLISNIAPQLERLSLPIIPFPRNLHTFPRLRELSLTLDMPIVLHRVSLKVSRCTQLQSFSLVALKPCRKGDLPTPSLALQLSKLQVQLSSASGIPLEDPVAEPATDLRFLGQLDLPRCCQLCVRTPFYGPFAPNSHPPPILSIIERFSSGTERLVISLEVR